ncbi:dual specificity protein phosphatase family protein [Skermanella pratensis]|uniref:dual specificity protein phosphatase family protein n=1 Tax=Skermanella pratensis TaxID=2233999 RepID=UPI00130146D4|nr:dual specificity protein phosphatase family protein [Skermanella pratensis]
MEKPLTCPPASFLSSYGKAAAVALLSILSVGLGIAALHLAIVLLGENFHSVVADELYRSAQPTPERIARYRKDYGIRTIINLRGDNTGSAWYDAEVEASRRLGIGHMDFRMSSRRELTVAQFGDLMALLRTAEKPVLIHCLSGADRSGLVSALYVAGIAGLGEEEAESQISFHYGHIPLWLNSAYAMNRSFEALEPALGFPDS